MRGDNSANKIEVLNLGLGREGSTMQPWRQQHSSSALTEMPVLAPHTHTHHTTACLSYSIHILKKILWQKKKLLQSKPWKSTGLQHKTVCRIFDLIFNLRMRVCILCAQVCLCRYSSPRGPFPLTTELGLSQIKQLYS